MRDDDASEEADGYDETLVPVDYDSAGLIRDDDIYATLVTALSQGVTLVSLMDCCHSGTVLDLPYQYRVETWKHFNPLSCDGGNILVTALLCFIIIFLIVYLSVTLSS